MKTFLFDCLVRTAIAAIWFSIIITATLIIKSCHDAEVIDEVDDVESVMPRKVATSEVNAHDITAFPVVVYDYDRMKCVSRVSIEDPRPDKQGSIGVPCGKCGACRANRRADWSFRLTQELKASKNAFFITLTYNDENLPINQQGLPTLQKRDYQLFIKKLRKENEKHWNEKFRYYIVGEYGTETGRPHYHIVGYNLHPDTIRKIQSIWNFGHTFTGDITPASIHYVTKYHVNTTPQEEINEETGEVIERTGEFASMSRGNGIEGSPYRYGIGSNYVDNVADWHTDNMYSHVVNNGHKQRLPRYYKEKIFSEYQRRRIAERNLEFMDKQYWREYERLKELGIDDPDHYMQRSAYRSAKQVKRKAQDGQTF